MQNGNVDDMMLRDLGAVKYLIIVYYVFSILIVFFKLFWPGKNGTVSS